VGPWAGSGPADAESVVLNVPMNGLFGKVPACTLLLHPFSLPPAYE
jgi:hypothetical protein